jgi:hypothetical protein
VAVALEVAEAVVLVAVVFVAVVLVVEVIFFPAGASSTTTLWGGPPGRYVTVTSNLTNGPDSIWLSPTRFGFLKEGWANRFLMN